MNKLINHPSLVFSEKLVIELKNFFNWNNLLDDLSTLELRGIFQVLKVILVETVIKR